MKILYDHQIFASQVYGGISRYFAEVSAHLAMKDGVDVHILCPLYVNGYIDAQAPVSVHGRRVGRAPHTTVAMRALNALLNPFRTDARQGVNIYHETYFSRINLTPKGAATVLTVHDMVHELFPDSFPALDFTREAKRIAIQRADHVICVSENTRRDLLDRIPVEPSRVSVVHHGSSLHRAKATPAKLRKPQLLYVGGRNTYKNFAAFLHAFSMSRLQHAGYSIVCFGGGPLSAQEQAYITRLGLAEVVTQHSGPDAALVQLFAESTALVYPSLYEGFGIPPLEAMSCGCPVVCSGTSSLPEVVGTAAEIIPNPSDPDAIRVAIEAVALSTTRMEALIEAGLMQSTRFSWSASANQTLDVYRNAM